MPGFQMFPNIGEVAASASIAEALSLMAHLHTHTLRVHDQREGRPLVLTEDDIIEKVAAYGLDPHSISVFQVFDYDLASDGAQDNAPKP